MLAALTNKIKLKLI